MSNTTVNQKTKDFLNNLIYNSESIRANVERRVYNGNNVSKTITLPNAA